MGDLFEVLSSKKIYHANTIKIHDTQIENSYPYVVRAATNNGIKGFIIDDPTFANKKNTLSFAQDTFTVFYQKQPYFTGNKVKILKPKFAFKSPKILHSISAILQFILKPLTWGLGSTTESIAEFKFSLPLKPTANAQTLEDIDFDFMEKFIAELEQCRLAELEQCRLAELQAYLKATGLENTTLSNDEENALNVFNNSGGGGGNTPCGLTWQSFRLGDLFEIEKTLSFNKDALTQGEDYDYITRTSQNQGVLQTTGFVNAENLNPPFTWSLGLLQMDFFYRKKSWYAGQFMRKITPKTEIENKIDLRIANYFTTLLNALKRPLLSVLVRDIDKTFREQKIQLPLKPTAKTQTLDGIDFDFMHTLINALMKQTIQGVAQYCDAKIQATKEVISQEAPVQKDSLF
ncbi:restriction endonuclease subunit S [Helicobacter pylori]|uniref:restriction endonuclease subunit S n=1 Tax=Helicobacter pylori TaxID=210 RepID=UPI000291CE54|nr:type IIS restriction enzyme R protein (BCGIB) [Helicobacter pylori 26695]AFV44289.1 type IIS restriction enzyme R protein (BCGIB) [Helicobacter pylori Rif1]AFV45879.1 type IIS restriction enzyme R protein (BCGIB) [Helicobacter pylori Rif2]